MATIKEIAERVGVSTTTVSNVIHGKTKKVSPANIDKIESLIREMEYSSDSRVREAVPRIFTNPWFRAML